MKYVKLFETWKLDASNSISEEENVSVEAIAPDEGYTEVGKFKNMKIKDFFALGTSSKMILIHAISSTAHLKTRKFNPIAFPKPMKPQFSTILGDDNKNKHERRDKIDLSAPSNYEELKRFITNINRTYQLDLEVPSQEYNITYLPIEVSRWDRYGNGECIAFTYLANFLGE